MVSLQKDLIFKDPNEILNVMSDISEEKIDLFSQKIYFKREDKIILINEGILKYIRILIENDKRIEYNKNYEIIEEYYQYIDFVRELLCDLKFENELEAAILTSILIKKGYFSIDNNFIKTYPPYNFDHFHGIDIILGKGCCRNFVEFYQDIFREIFKHPLSFGGTLDNKKFDFQKSDHVINLISYNGQLCGYDLANNLFFSFINKRKMITISGKHFIFYSPLWDIISSKYSFAEINEHINGLGQNCNVNISLDELRKIRSQVQEKVARNLRLLNSFYKDTNHIKENIKELAKEKSHFHV